MLSRRESSPRVGEELNDCQTFGAACSSIKTTASKVPQAQPKRPAMLPPPQSFLKQFEVNKKQELILQSGQSIEDDMVNQADTLQMMHI